VVLATVEQMSASLAIQLTLLQNLVIIVLEQLA
jgi:hypothetical protein